MKIKPGDHMVRIAAKARAGKPASFLTYRTIWDANPDLQAKCDSPPNPNILLPGADLTLPAVTAKTVDSLATEQTHKFVIPVDNLDIHFVFHDENDLPFTTTKETTGEPPSGSKPIDNGSLTLPDLEPDRDLGSSRSCIARSISPSVGRTRTGPRTRTRCGPASRRCSASSRSPSGSWIR